MKAVIYARVSTKEQEDSGYSLPAQVKLLEEYAEKKNLACPKIITISESASGKQLRKTFNEMLEYATKNKIKHLVFEKVDRATRNFKEAEKLNDWLQEDGERRVHSIKDGIILHKNSTSQEKLNWDLRIVLAKNYVNNLSEEVKKGQKEKISQGGYPSQPPVGYISMGEKGHIRHIVDPQKGAYIKKAFEMYATGLHSVMSLLEEMDKEGFRGRNGRHMVKGRFYDILRNPFYYGYFRWNGELYKGVHEPIVTKELFDQVQGVLGGKGQPRKAVHNHLFKGLMKCGECGGVITWEMKKGHTYGHCHHYKPCAQKAYSKEHEKETEIIEKLNDLIVFDPELAEWIKQGLKISHKDAIEYHNKAMSELEEKYRKYSKRLETIYEDKLDEVITKEQYKARYNLYKEELDRITEQIDKQKQSNLNYHEKSIKVYELSQDAVNIYKESSKEERRALLKMVFKTMTITDDKLETEFTDTFQILYKAVQETNSSKVLENQEINFETLEPVDFSLIQTKKAPIGPICSIWRPRPDSNR